ncbi:MAG: hypothetical protein ACYS6K_08595 [Planctomycetota bacterium]
MIALFRKNLYQWPLSAVILISILGCMSLPDAEHEETIVTTAAKPSPAAKFNEPTYRLVLDNQIAGIPEEGWSKHYFSPNGDRIAFRSRGKLYVAELNGTVIRPILDDPGPWKMRCANWSPDGRWVVYVGTREVTSQSGTHKVSAIFIVSPDGGGPRQISPEVRGDWWIYRGIQWTPDGQHLSYSDPIDSDPCTGGLHTLTLDGNEVRFIPNKDMADEGARLPYGDGYSPDGRWFVYSRMKDNATHSFDMDLYIIPTLGGTSRRLTHLPGSNGHVTWAPDSRSFYFVSGPPTSRPIGTRNIWRLPMDPETGLARGEPQQVTFFKYVSIAHPKVLGDGSRIGFMMRRKITSIQVADASSPHEARSLVRSVRHGPYSPRLSPSGQTVYYVSDMPGEEGIYAMPRQGGTPRRLTEDLGISGHVHGSPFDLSPDGRTLAYSVKLSEGKGLFTLSSNGGEPHLLVKIPGKDCAMPQWSPDGLNLAFTADKGLYVIPAAGGKAHKLAHMEAWKSTVRWSPDGKFIAAIGYPKPKSASAVFVVPASGGELRQLTPDVDDKEWIEWHPDGTRLTYHVIRSEVEIHQAYPDGRSPTTLLANAPDTIPWAGRWAPGGRCYFFVSSGGDGGSGIYVYDETSGETKLCVRVPYASVPCWSSDGKTMVWSASRKSIWQSWIMRDFLPESATSR